MSSDTRRKTLFYKRAELTTAIQGESLQTLLEKAFVAHKFPLLRKENPSGDNSYYNSVKRAAKDGAPGAQVIYERLKKRFESEPEPPAPPTP